MSKGSSAPAIGIRLFLLGLCYACGMMAGAAESPSAALAAGAASAASAVAGGATARPAGVAAGSQSEVPPLAPPMSAASVIQVLDETVDWYRTLGQQQQAANEPSDMLFLYDNRQTANKVMALAFDIARANADILAKSQPSNPDNGSDTGLSSGTLAQYSQKFDAQAAAVQKEIAASRRELGSAPTTSRADIEAKIHELNGELDLINTKKSIVQTMSDFVTGAGSSSSGSLRAQIDAMAVALPAAATGNAAAGTSASPAATTATPAPTLLGPGASAQAGRFGLWDLAANAFRLSQKAGTITSIDRRTAALQSSILQLRAPLLTQLKALSARGDDLAARADSADTAALNTMHDELDSLAEEFKQASALLLPLSREGILLGQYRRTLANWRNTIDGQYREALAVLGLRLAVVLAVLGILFGAAEVWQRTVLRYIQDTRRRYQLLLLRRIALWSLVVIVIGVAFASELGSIVTFAGLITAGIAVAMQSVLVSIVGYFFLIGKYGIRVGDRVQIGEVAGEVIDLGLVRMYLMELGNKGSTGPTGRVVAFANSVVFQVASGLFKQIPGVNFTWRETVLTLPPGVDTAVLKNRLMAAVKEASKDYQADILRQTQEIERTTLSASSVDSEPRVQLRFSPTGVEALVRYPVNLVHAAEIDERVTESLARVITDVKG